MALPQQQLDAKLIAIYDALYEDYGMPSRPPLFPPHSPTELSTPSMWENAMSSFDSGDLASLGIEDASLGIEELQLHTSNHAQQLTVPDNGRLQSERSITATETFPLTRSMQLIADYIRCGGDINIQHETIFHGLTFFQMACYYSDLSLVEWLLQSYPTCSPYLYGKIHRQHVLVLICGSPYINQYTLAIIMKLVELNATAKSATSIAFHPLHLLLLSPSMYCQPTPRDGDNTTLGATSHMGRDSSLPQSSSSSNHHHPHQVLPQPPSGTPVSTYNHPYTCSLAIYHVEVFHFLYTYYRYTRMNETLGPVEALGCLFRNPLLVWNDAYRELLLVIIDAWKEAFHIEGSDSQKPLQGGSFPASRQKAKMHDVSLSAPLSLQHLKTRLQKKERLDPFQRVVYFSYHLQRPYERPRSIYLSSIIQPNTFELNRIVFFRDRTLNNEWTLHDDTENQQSNIILQELLSREHPLVSAFPLYACLPRPYHHTASLRSPLSPLSSGVSSPSLSSSKSSTSPKETFRNLHDHHHDDGNIHDSYHASRTQRHSTSNDISHPIAPSTSTPQPQSDQIPPYTDPLAHRCGDLPYQAAELLYGSLGGPFIPGESTFQPFLLSCDDYLSSIGPFTQNTVKVVEIIVKYHRLSVCAWYKDYIHALRSVMKVNSDGSVNIDDQQPQLSSLELPVAPQALLSPAGIDLRRWCLAHPLLSQWTQHNYDALLDIVHILTQYHQELIDFQNMQHGLFAHFTPVGTIFAVVATPLFTDDDLAYLAGHSSPSLTTLPSLARAQRQSSVSGARLTIPVTPPSDALARQKTYLAPIIVYFSTFFSHEITPFQLPAASSVSSSDTAVATTTAGQPGDPLVDLTTSISTSSTNTPTTVPYHAILKTSVDSSITCTFLTYIASDEHEGHTESNYTPGYHFYTPIPIAYHRDLASIVKNHPQSLLSPPDLSFLLAPPSTSGGGSHGSQQFLPSSHAQNHVLDGYHHSIPYDINGFVEAFHCGVTHNPSPYLMASLLRLQSGCSDAQDLMYDNQHNSGDNRNHSSGVEPGLKSQLTVETSPSSTVASSTSSTISTSVNTPSALAPSTGSPAIVSGVRPSSRTVVVATPTALETESQHISPRSSTYDHATSPSSSAASSHRRQASLLSGIPSDVFVHTQHLQQVFIRITAFPTLTQPPSIDNTMTSIRWYRKNPVTLFSHVFRSITNYMYNAPHQGIFSHVPLPSGAPSQRNGLSPFDYYRYVLLSPEDSTVQPLFHFPDPSHHDVPFSKGYSPYTAAPGGRRSAPSSKGTTLQHIIPSNQCVNSPTPLDDILWPSLPVPLFDKDQGGYIPSSTTSMGGGLLSIWHSLRAPKLGDAELTSTAVNPMRLLQRSLMQSLAFLRYNSPDQLLQLLTVYADTYLSIIFYHYITLRCVFDAILVQETNRDCVEQHSQIASDLSIPSQDINYHQLSRNVQTVWSESVAPFLLSIPVAQKHAMLLTAFIPDVSIFLYTMSGQVNYQLFHYIATRATTIYHYDHLNAIIYAVPPSNTNTNTITSSGDDHDDDLGSTLAVTSSHNLPSSKVSPNPIVSGCVLFLAYLQSTSSSPQADQVRADNHSPLLGSKYITSLLEHVQALNVPLVFKFPFLLDDGIDQAARESTTTTTAVTTAVTTTTTTALTENPAPAAGQAMGSQLADSDVYNVPQLCFINDDMLVHWLRYADFIPPGGQCKELVGSVSLGLGELFSPSSSSTNPNNITSTSQLESLSSTDALQLSFFHYLLQVTQLNHELAKSTSILLRCYARSIEMEHEGLFDTEDGDKDAVTDGATDEDLIDDDQLPHPPTKCTEGLFKNIADCVKNILLSNDKDDNEHARVDYHALSGFRHHVIQRYLPLCRKYLSYYDVIDSLLYSSTYLEVPTGIRPPGKAPSAGDSETAHDDHHHHHHHHPHTPPPSFHSPHSHSHSDAVLYPYNHILSSPSFVSYQSFSFDGMNGRYIPLSPPISPKHGFHGHHDSPIAGLAATGKGGTKDIVISSQVEPITTTAHVKSWLSILLFLDNIVTSNDASTKEKTDGGCTTSQLHSMHRKYKGLSLLHATRLYAALFTNTSFLSKAGTSLFLYIKDHLGVTFKYQSVTLRFIYDNYALLFPFAACLLPNPEYSGRSSSSTRKTSRDNDDDDVPPLTPPSTTGTRQRRYILTTEADHNTLSLLYPPSFVQQCTELAEEFKNLYSIAISAGITEEYTVVLADELMYRHHTLLLSIFLPCYILELAFQRYQYSTWGDVTNMTPYPYIYQNLPITMDPNPMLSHHIRHRSSGFTHHPYHHLAASQQHRPFQTIPYIMAPSTASSLHLGISSVYHIIPSVHQRQFAFLASAVSGLTHSPFFAQMVDACLPEVRFHHLLDSVGRFALNAQHALHAIFGLLRKGTHTPSTAVVAMLLLNIETYLVQAAIQRCILAQQEQQQHRVDPSQNQLAGDVALESTESVFISPPSMLKVSSHQADTSVGLGKNDMITSPPLLSLLPTLSSHYTNSLGTSILTDNQGEHFLLDDHASVPIRLQDLKHYQLEAKLGLPSLTHLLMPCQALHNMGIGVSSQHTQEQVHRPPLVPPPATHLFYYLHLDSLKQLPVVTPSVDSSLVLPFIQTVEPFTKHTPQTSSNQDVLLHADANRSGLDLYGNLTEVLPYHSIITHPSFVYRNGILDEVNQSTFADNYFFQGSYFKLQVMWSRLEFTNAFVMSLLACLASLSPSPDLFAFLFTSSWMQSHTQTHAHSTVGDIGNPSHFQSQSSAFRFLHDYYHNYMTERASAVAAHGQAANDISIHNTMQSTVGSSSSVGLPYCTFNLHTHTIRLLPEAGVHLHHVALALMFEHRVTSPNLIGIVRLLLGYDVCLNSLSIIDQVPSYFSKIFSNRHHSTSGYRQHEVARNYLARMVLTNLESIERDRLVFTEANTAHNYAIESQYARIRRSIDGHREETALRLASFGAHKSAEDETTSRSFPPLTNEQRLTLLFMCQVLGQCTNLNPILCFTRERRELFALCVQHGAWVHPVILKQLLLSRTPFSLDALPIIQTLLTHFSFRLYRHNLRQMREFGKIYDAFFSPGINQPASLFYHRILLQLIQAGVHLAQDNHGFIKAILYIYPIIDHNAISTVLLVLSLGLEQPYQHPEQVLNTKFNSMMTKYRLTFSYDPPVSSSSTKDVGGGVAVDGGSNPLKSNTTGNGSTAPGGKHPSNAQLRSVTDSPSLKTMVVHNLEDSPYQRPSVPDGKDLPPLPHLSLDASSSAPPGGAQQFQRNISASSLSQKSSSDTPDVDVIHRPSPLLVPSIVEHKGVHSTHTATSTLGGGVVPLEGASGSAAIPQLSLQGLNKALPPLTLRPSTPLSRPITPVTTPRNSHALPTTPQSGSTGPTTPSRKRISVSLSTSTPYAPPGSNPPSPPSPPVPVLSLPPALQLTSPADLDKRKVGPQPAYRQQPSVPSSPARSHNRRHSIGAPNYLYRSALPQSYQTISYRLLKQPIRLDSGRVAPRPPVSPRSAHEVFPSVEKVSLVSSMIQKAREVYLFPEFLESKQMFIMIFNFYQSFKLLPCQRFLTAVESILWHYDPVVRAMFTQDDYRRYYHNPDISLEEFLQPYMNDDDSQKDGIDWNHLDNLTSPPSAYCENASSDSNSLTAKGFLWHLLHHVYQPSVDDIMFLLMDVRKTAKTPPGSRVHHHQGGQGTEPSDETADLLVDGELDGDAVDDFFDQLDGIPYEEDDFDESALHLTETPSSEHLTPSDKLPSKPSTTGSDVDLPIGGNSPGIHLHHINELGQSILMMAVLRRWNGNTLLCLVNAVGLDLAVTHRDYKGRDLLEYLYLTYSHEEHVDLVQMLEAYKSQHQQQQQQQH